MPGIDGLGFAEQVRNLDDLRHIPIVMLISGTGTRDRERCKELNIATDADEISITVSLGAAVSSAASPVHPEAMLSNADDALYRAKEGRNRSEMCIANPESPETEILSAESGP
jgi:PleD family two-component response regulator